MIALYNIIVTTNNAFPAPSVIIYDNACNLHSYCLNREPAFFKQSWMVVDRFHWPNHTGTFNTLTDLEYADYEILHMQVVALGTSLMPTHSFTTSTRSWWNKQMQI